jgi:2-iminobutanoate/2-iminopropanoate deaminase
MSTQKRQIVHSTKAPPAVGPYSQAVRSGHLVFTSGQIPLDPDTGQLVQGSIEDQTHRVMANLSAVLTAAGTSLANAVKATIFLTNLSDFAKVNAVYATYFATEPPARSTVQVLGLPLGAAVEIEIVAEIS